MSLSPLSLFLQIHNELDGERSRAEPSRAEQRSTFFPMTHRCVSLFLNIFSLQCCVFILSERGLCYGLHTTIVYGFFNQHQIMESCLHLWAHPQKLEVCVCCYDLMIPPRMFQYIFSPVEY